MTHSLLSDENKINSTANWCQFRENEKKFGLKSEFNEDLYTSKLDLENIDDERRRRAEEIEKVILIIEKGHFTRKINIEACIGRKRTYRFD